MGLVVDLCLLVGVTLVLRSPVAMPSWWLVVAVCVDVRHGCTDYIDLLLQIGGVCHIIG